MNHLSHSTMKITTRLGRVVASEKMQCPDHGEFIARKFSSGMTTICPACFHEETLAISRQEDKALRQSRKTGWHELFGHAGLPERFMQRGFSNFNTDTEDQRRALDIAKTYANDFAEMRRIGRGLVFIGPTGTGKTHLVAAICKAAMRLKYDVLFTSVLGMTQVVKEAYRPGAGMSEREAARKFVQPDLLALDEVGVQHMSATEQMIITDVINQRYESMRPTIMVSNLGITKLGECLGPRVIDRMKEVSRVVVCDWKSYRGRAQ